MMRPRSSASCAGGATITNRASSGRSAGGALRDIEETTSWRDCSRIAMATARRAAAWSRGATRAEWIDVELPIVREMASYHFSVVPRFFRVSVSRSRPARSSAATWW
jgi:hypothetical protein